MSATLHTGKKGTMPFFMWKHDVVAIANVSMKDADELGRVFLHAWYEAGEPVWMAADSLKHVVRVAKRERRADRDAAHLRKMVKVLK